MMAVDCEAIYQEYLDINKRLDDAPLKEKKGLRKRRAELLRRLQEDGVEYLKTKGLKPTAHGLVDISILPI